MDKEREYPDLLAAAKAGLAIAEEWHGLLLDSHCIHADGAPLRGTLAPEMEEDVAALEKQIADIRAAIDGSQSNAL